MKHKGFILIFTTIITFIFVSSSYVTNAQTLESTNYKIGESFIGPGGDIDSSSANYKSRASIGDIAVGETDPGSGGNYKTIPGYNTTDEPSLIFVVDSSNVAFGSLSLSSTTTATATFSAYNYTSFGYVIQTIGTPPSNGSHTLTALSTMTAPAVGTEQYGINLVANTIPTSFGADPVQVPASNFSYGVASSGYDTTNQYKYVNGETVAYSPKSSGRTDYTISYIANISTTTPGGSYGGSQELVCIGTY